VATSLRAALLVHVSASSGSKVSASDQVQSGDRKNYLKKLKKKKRKILLCFLRMQKVNTFAELDLHLLFNISC